MQLKGDLAAEAVYSAIAVGVAQALQGMSAPAEVRPRLDYSPHEPHARQAEFLALGGEEAFYGGAAGGGKSDALLMAALQYVHIPGYSALILRRTFPELTLPDAIMHRAGDWLGPTDARLSGGRTWVFPSGANLSFGYLARYQDVHQYQSAAFQYIAFDELTAFLEPQYLYLFSRLRRPEALDGEDIPLARVPLRMRGASNPGNIGHEWVKERFPIERERAEGDPAFIAARLDDNPSLDQASYTRSLERLDAVTREQLLRGDWSARGSGGFFERDQFIIVPDVPALGIQWCRFWDLAATEVSEVSPDPDYTVGALVGRDALGVWYIRDVRRVRLGPGAVKRLIIQTMLLDGLDTWVRMEQEGGASGKSLIADYRQTLDEEMPGVNFAGIAPTGSKQARAMIVVNRAEDGMVRLVRGEWVQSYLEELDGFPLVGHDDQVDATSGAFQALMSWRPPTSVTDTRGGTHKPPPPKQGEPGWDPWIGRD